MKLSLIALSVGSLLAFVGCSHRQPGSEVVFASVEPPLPKKTTVDDCYRVYNHALYLKFQEIKDPNRSYSFDEIAGMTGALDKIYTSDGTRDRFIAQCVGNFNQDQVACMTGVYNLPSMNLCEIFFDKKNQ